MNLRSWWRRKRKVTLGLIVSAICLLFYANQIEPYRIEVTRYQLSAPLQSPIKIAHLSDLHSGGIGKREEKMLAILEAEQPDLIIVSGDLISTDADYAGCRDVLKRLHASLGVFIAPGNHESWFPPPEGRAYFEGIGVNLLVNQSRQIRDEVWLLGLDDMMTRQPDFEKANQGVPDAAYKIAFFHSPAFFNNVAGKCNLVLAGHSHGGQVRVPFINPFWLPEGCGDYIEGWYERDGSRMYVSRGIGNSILQLRFNCRPEIAIITVGK